MRACETKGNNLNTYLNIISKNLTLNAVTGLKLTSSIRGVDLARADPVAKEDFMYRMRQFVVGSFGLDSVHPTASTIAKGLPTVYVRY
jgi:hypothetical protein